MPIEDSNAMSETGKTHLRMLVRAECLYYFETILGHIGHTTNANLKRII